MKTSILFLALAGCGGDPFAFGVTSAAELEGGIPIVDPPDAGEAGEAGKLTTRRDAGAIEATDASFDAGADAPFDARLDAPPMMVDATPDASPIDASSPIDAAPTCTPIAPYAVVCGPLATVISTAPLQYCLNVGMVGMPTTTPIACQCAETYNCACLGSVCPAGHALIGCGVGHGPALRVDCQ